MWLPVINNGLVTFSFKSSPTSAKSQLSGGSSELDKLVPLPHHRHKSTLYSGGLHDFLATIPRYYKYIYANFFFFALLDSIEFFTSRMLSCDRRYKWLLSLELIDTIFLWVLSEKLSYTLFIFFFSFSWNCTPCSGCSLMHGLKLNFKKSEKN